MGSDLGLGTSKGINPIALRKAKIVYNFGFSECIRVKYETGGPFSGISIIRPRSRLFSSLFIIIHNIFPLVIYD